LDSPEIQLGLNLLTNSDEIWAKLDAGTQTFMDTVNRSRVPLDKILANILALGRKRPVIIQSLFPLLNGRAPSETEISEYIARLQELSSAGANIPLVQIYSANRPMTNARCGHMPLKTLANIAKSIHSATGIKAEVF
jgi:hypothetical protein